MDIMEQTDEKRGMESEKLMKDLHDTFQKNN